MNFISELQEQMCRFQKEINSKIQEKKASQIIPAESSSPATCPSEAAKVDSSNHGLPRGKTSAAVHELEEELEEEPDGSAHGLQDGDAEEQRHCGGESVGACPLACRF